MLPHALERVRESPGAYLQPVTLDGLATFLGGYDAALMGGLLSGFREWLIVRVDGGNNFHWQGLIERLQSAGDQRRPTQEPPDDPEAWISYAFVVLEAFLKERGSRGGAKGIFLKYQAWLESQSWYKKSLDG